MDNLERLSGLPENKFIEAHGTFNTGHCTVCGAEYDFTYMRSKYFDHKNFILLIVIEKRSNYG